MTGWELSEGEKVRTGAEDVSTTWNPQHSGDKGRMMVSSRPAWVSQKNGREGRRGEGKEGEGR